MKMTVASPENIPIHLKRKLEELFSTLNVEVFQHYCLACE